MFLHYKKNDNASLFKEIEATTEMRQLQNYFPLYTRYFSISDTNWNQFNLNQHYQLKHILKRDSSHHYEIQLQNEQHTQKRTAFIKFSPLFDPLKYIIGKFKHDIFTLPEWKKTTNPVYDDPNNVAYVDAFFSYLSSQLLHRFGFPNAIDFYGCYLGIKHNFDYNACDDLDYIHNSTHFIERNDLFKCNNPYIKELINMNTRKNKERLEIQGDADEDIEIEDLLKPSERKEALDTLFKPVENTVIDTSANVANVIYEHEQTTTKYTNDSDSECSSRSSDTDETQHTGIQSDSTSSYDDSTATEDEVIVQITDFPVQMIVLEKLQDTLDAYLSENMDTLTTSEWMSILFQIVVSLYTYQKMFDMTHNDLHTNNIMYTHTDAEFIVYKINHRYFRIPTYNKIYKIIDFGRSIYTYQGQRHMSSSYAKTGDAVGQYNTAPYFDENKRPIEPNYSFDLCRLACSLFDFLDDELDADGEKTAHVKLVDTWIRDDKGKNILYKSNGKERYPGFKLYKMIARLVHNHLPEKLLNDETFSMFLVSKSKLKKRKIIDVDEIVKQKDKI
jgi:hypothetical protein